MSYACYLINSLAISAPDWDGSCSELDADADAAVTDVATGLPDLGRAE